MLPRLPLQIVATARALPDNWISSEELDARLGKKPGYVARRSGMRGRYHAPLDLSQGALAARALQAALNTAGWTEHDVDLLLSVSGVPEQALPTTASKIAAEMGWSGLPAYDVNASCVGLLPALVHAGALIQSGVHRRIAVVASDLASRGIDFNDEESSYIFGDGAAAVLVEHSAGQGIVAQRMQTFPEGREWCQIRAGGTARNAVAGMQREDFFFRMQGKKLFRQTAERMPEFLQGLFADLPYGLDDIDLVIPHQASHLGLLHLRERLHIPESKIVTIFAEHGNQVAASLGCALDEARRLGKWLPDQKILFVGTAAGLSLAALVWET